MAFVYDSWARSFQKSPFAGCIPNHLYPQVSRAASAEIADRAKVLVAYADLEDGTRRIVGYSVSEPERKILHWLFIKNDYRRLGYGTALLKETCGDNDQWFYTHRTRSSVPFLGPRFRWDDKYARVKG